MRLRKIVLLVAVMMAAGSCVAQQPGTKTPAAPAPAAAPHDAKDIAGDWQGTLKLPQTSLRLVVKFSKGEKGMTARFFSIDQPSAPPFNASSFSQNGNEVKFAIELIAANYTGTLNAEGSLMAGTWTQGATSFPLDLVRATKETAWEIPAPAAAPKPMAADADPAFDVATIKPSDPSITSMQGLVVSGRNFKTKGSSLGDLLCFAYDVQMKQLAGAPDWLNKDRYDLDAVPDTEGVPNGTQLRTMVRKLLADRFKLKVHVEKREMNAFVLSVSKAGPKLTVSELKGQLPGLGLRPGTGGVTLVAMNSTMANLASFLQMIVLDRPVVDQTGLTPRYDVTLKFTPDDSQFNGHPPQVPKNESVESFPSLFEGIQQQLGLKLEAQKAPVDVIVFDHVEKPSAN